MNDLAVVALIFGNLMYSVHFEAGDSQVKVKQAMNTALHRYSTHCPPNRNSSEDRAQGSSSLLASNSGMMPISSLQNSNSQAFSAGNENKSHYSSGVGKKSGTMRASGHSRLTSPSEVSWGGMNQSVQESLDEDSTDASEEPVAPLPASSSTKPVDVLKNSRASWGGVNFSTYEGNDSGGDISNDDDGNVNGNGSENGSGGIEPVPDDEPPMSRPSLPPPSLPKERPKHMSYAESRISRLRTSHAKIKSSRSGSGLRRSGEEGTDSTVGSNSHASPRR